MVFRIWRSRHSEIVLSQLFRKNIRLVILKVIKLLPLLSQAACYLNELTTCHSTDCCALKTQVYLKFLVFQNVGEPGFSLDPGGRHSVII